MSKQYRIALLMGQDIGYCRWILRGIQSYAITQPDWTFRDSNPDLRVMLVLKKWDPDGIIGHVFDKKLSSALQKFGKPWVNTTTTIPSEAVPFVEVEHRSVGRLAAEHFLERGFRNFGFFGSDWAVFSKEREAGYEERLGDEGFPANCCYANFLPRLPVEEEGWGSLDERIRKWLVSLPKPVAILASNDRPAKRLMHTCRDLGLDVPSQVAILGVDDDQIECHLTTPPLSSIALPAERIGYEAALMLDHLIHGRQLAQPQQFFPPVGVVTRQSTDIVAVENVALARAIGYIRNHAIEDISVEDVVSAAHVSRRNLERQFKSAFGRSVLNEIRYTRVDRCRELLAKTDLPMPIIAEQTGFSNAARFCHVFRQFVGEPPSAFRHRVRMSGPHPSMKRKEVSPVIRNVAFD